MFRSTAAQGVLLPYIYKLTTKIAGYLYYVPVECSTKVLGPDIEVVVGVVSVCPSIAVAAMFTQKLRHIERNTHAY